VVSLSYVVVAVAVSVMLWFYYHQSRDVNYKCCVHISVMSSVPSWGRQSRCQLLWLNLRLKLVQQKQE
jgi:hypothetical protein